MTSTSVWRTRGSMASRLPKHLFLDANVLYSPIAFDVFLTLAEQRAVEAMWSHTVVDEALRAIERRSPQVTKAAAKRFEVAGTFFRTALVEGWEDTVDDISGLPDPDDRHVVAAAAEGGCEAIITFNLRDFPADALRPHGLTAISPDDYLVKLLTDDAPTVHRAMQALEDAKRNPPRTREEERGLLARSGLVRFAKALTPGQ